MLRFRQTHNTHEFWKQAQMSKLARFSSKISVCVCLCVYIYMCVHVCMDVRVCARSSPNKSWHLPWPAQMFV